MDHLRDLHVLVLGLGTSGLAMARWCAGAGARVSVWDSRELPPQADALRQALPKAVLLSDALGDHHLAGVQMLLKSPGLAPSNERIAPVLAAAREAGIPILGELDLFARALADLKAERGYAPKVVGITGTNGKTTTTAMAALLIERSGKRVAMAGNIGPTLLDTLAAALAAESPDQPLPEVWVLELSSFQLDGVQGFEPDAAAVLNVTQDHLDWHGSMDAYSAAKTRVFGAGLESTAVMVINRGDLRTEAMVPAPVRIKGGPGRPASFVGRKVLRFGLDAPQHPGDFGLVNEGGMSWLVRAMEADETIKARKGEAPEIHLQHLMPVDALRVRGRHNAANALAALALGVAIGRPLAPMLHALRDYAGEPHRVEFVAQVGGVDAFDDSKGTNVGATVAALDGLGADLAPGRLVVILGGDGKGQDFSPLAAPVTRYVRAAALIGRDAETIAATLSNTGVVMKRFATLPEATRWCFAQAQPGDAVLLSPACASLDMFRHYGHRAEVFVATVRELAAERGGVMA